MKCKSKELVIFVENQSNFVVKRGLVNGWPDTRHPIIRNSTRYLTNEIQVFKEEKGSLLSYKTAQRGSSKSEQSSLFFVFLCLYLYTLLRENPYSMYIFLYICAFISHKNKKRPEYYPMTSFCELYLLQFIIISIYSLVVTLIWLRSGLARWGVWSSQIAMFDKAVPLMVVKLLSAWGSVGWWL